MQRAARNERVDETGVFLLRHSHKAFFKLTVMINGFRHMGAKCDVCCTQNEDTVPKQYLTLTSTTTADAHNQWCARGYYTLLLTGMTIIMCSVAEIVYAETMGING